MNATREASEQLSVQNLRQLNFISRLTFSLISEDLMFFLKNVSVYCYFNTSPHKYLKY